MKKFTSYLTIVLLLLSITGIVKADINTINADTVHSLLPDTLSYHAFTPNNRSISPSEVNTGQYCQVLDKLACFYFDSVYNKNLDSSHPLFSQWEQIEHAFLNDSMLAQKIQQLPTSLDLAYNRHVKRWIQVYAIERTELTERVLGLKKKYYPLYEEVFAKYDIPLSIKHLSVVESALNPDARSWMGAQGLWQFMYYTGRRYGLHTNYYVDERMDPFQATVAAAEYFTDLYQEFDDWLLVIAAYNCGPGRVRRAIRYAGGTHDYWEIRKYLPRETRGYVPAFIAVNYIMHYYEDYKLQPTPPPSNFPTFSYSKVEQIKLYKRTPLRTLSKYLHVNKKRLKRLNPSLKEGFVPNMSLPYKVNVPCGKKIAFSKKEDKIYQTAEKTMKDILGEERERIVYRVRWGDNLSTIADRYNCRVREIIEWNGLRGTRIQANDKLVLYVGNYSPSQAQKEEEQVQEQQKQNSSEKKTEQTATTADQSPNKAMQFNPLSNTYVYHEVDWGDTLWDIAKEYPGISPDDIKQSNNIKNTGDLKPGMVLKINLSNK